MKKILTKDTGTDDQPLEIKVSGDTVVIEEKPTTETWVFDDDLGYGCGDRDYSVNFLCDSKLYKLISGVSCEKIWYYGVNDEDTKRVFHVDDGWTNQTYRTIVLLEPATGDLLTFLQANAVKQ